jgi:hypothetical protein
MEPYLCAGHGSENRVVIKKVDFARSVSQSRLTEQFQCKHYQRPPEISRGGAQILFTKGCADKK